MRTKVSEGKPIGLQDLNDPGVRREYMDLKALILAGPEREALASEKKRTEHEYQHVLGPAAHRATQRRDRLHAEQAGIPARRAQIAEQASVYRQRLDDAEARLKGAVEILSHLLGQTPTFTVGDTPRTFNIGDGIAAVRAARQACREAIDELSTRMSALDAIEAASLRRDDAEAHAKAVRERGPAVDAGMRAELAACDERAEQITREIADCEREIEAGAAAMKARDDAHKALAAFDRQHRLS